MGGHVEPWLNRSVQQVPHIRKCVFTCVIGHVEPWLNHFVQQVPHIRKWVFTCVGGHVKPWLNHSVQQVPHIRKCVFTCVSGHVEPWMNHFVQQVPHIRKCVFTCVGGHVSNQALTKLKLATTNRAKIRIILCSLCRRCHAIDMSIHRLCPMTQSLMHVQNGWRLEPSPTYVTLHLLNNERLAVIQLSLHSIF